MFCALMYDIYLLSHSVQGGSLGVCGFDGSHPIILVRVEVLSGLVKQAAKKQLSTKTTLLLVASAANSHLQPNLV
jgi:hypothetical protein